MGAYTFMREIWRRKQSTVMRYLQRIRSWELRQLPAIHRASRPMRPEKARQMGYKAKQGYVIYRVRIRRGTRKRQNSKGIVYGKPTNHGIRKRRWARNLRSLAESRAGKVCGNLRVLSSYWINEDASFKFFEVILVDPQFKGIRNDPQINWICKARAKHRELRGVTGAGRKGRGIGKGPRYVKTRVSKSAFKRRQNTTSLRRYR